MKNFLIVMAALAAVVILVILGCVGIYNSIVSKDENITSRWAQVENQLQRRYDLIPNLVNSVKGYAEHEKTVFEDVTKARSQWASARTRDDKVSAASAMDSALGRLIAVAENYPQLKADGTFLKLMDELAGAENRIAVERMRYNDAVMDFNVTVRRFPGNIVASFFGYKPANEYFRADEKAAAAPVVRF
ncbi:MAG: LemA family protein [Candidatus Omnitrophica bacterium]|nr:LemA family protein [Candidatus Omnitrophota bacterium]